MERANQANEIKWKKIGGGALRLKNRIIKPGQIFSARADEIPKAFLDTCIPLDEVPVVPESPAIILKNEYKIVLKGKSKFLYDVVDDNGKVINEKGLTKEVAENLVKDLEK